MNVKKDIFLRVLLSFLLILIFGVAIVVQIIKIQFVQGEYWSELSENLTTAFVNIEPVRGNIYAADGSLMATSLPIYDIRMDMRADALTDEIFNTHVDSLAWYLADYFKDKSTAEYKHLLKTARANGNRYYLIKRRVSHKQIKDVVNFPIFRLGRYRGGFILEQRNRRIKPFQLLAKRTLGYNIPGVTPVGLEGAYDEYLSGISGKRLMQKLSGGVWIPINDENELDPRHGQDIITTIDINIQDVTENSLLRELIRHNASHGCAIVMEVETGAIKAIANLAKDESGQYHEKYNFAIGETTEPGSTFKLASMMALLEHGYIKPEDTINTGAGEFKFFDRIMRDTREGGFGIITYHHAFAVSSNIAFSRAVQQNYAHQPQKFTDFMHSLNIGAPLGIEIAGEGKPMIKNPGDRDWSGITLPWMSIGYEVMFTPLQMLTLYNAVANGGKMMKPLFVSEVRDVGKRVQQFSPEIINNKICSDKTLKQLQSMLEAVIDSGTARNIRSSEYKIAGKTGTALIASRSAGYKKQRMYQASFAGYFPADKPKYSCIVVINSPSSGIFYGNLVAAPVFREIADKIYAHKLDIHEQPLKKRIHINNKPDFSPAHINNIRVLALQLQIPFRPDPINDEFVNTKFRDSLLLFQPGKFQVNNTVPDVRGMVLTDAVYLLESAGFKVNFTGSGKVRQQSVLPGTAITGNQKIILNLN